MRTRLARDAGGPEWEPSHRADGDRVHAVSDAVNHGDEARDDERALRAAKAELRRALRAARRRRSPAERDRAAAGLAEVLAARPEFSRAALVAGYAAMPAEPSVDRALDRIRGRAEVILPLVIPGNGLSWAHDDGRRRPATSDIGGAEPTGRPCGPGAPSRAGLILVPALAVSLDGVRLGQGGGYYDRALEHVTGPVRAAVVFDDEVLAPGRVPAEPFDLRVDAVVTPTRWIPVSRAAGASGRS